MVRNMIEVGEETGELDKMLLKIADTYDADVDMRVAAFKSVLEPVMILCLGGIVGFIVVSLFAPLIELVRGFSTQVGGLR
jgi:type IV pilus assembly protein PilC